VKLASRKLATPSDRQRELRRTDRVRAQLMREAFPDLAELRVEMTFADGTATPPSAQAHAFYPGARVFFRFACPCSDCGGEFDLTSAIGAALAGGKRAATDGRMPCEGMRRGTQAEPFPCPVSLRYRITARDEP
jgi:hypothetical protein